MPPCSQVRGCSRFCSGIFRQRVRVFRHRNQKHVYRDFSSTLVAGEEAPSVVAQIELAPRLVKEQCPAVGANQERNRNRGSVGREKWRDLPINHPIEVAPPIKLIRPFTQAEHRRIRSSNDRDQKAEREGRKNRHNEGYDEAADGNAREPQVERVIDE